MAFLVEEAWSDGLWMLWGIVGIALGGSLLVASIVNDTVRIAIWVGLGVGLGVLLVAALVEEVVAILASAITFAGTALIVSSIPKPEPTWQQAPEEA